MRKSKIKIETNAIFVKYLCGATSNDHLKVEPRVLSKENYFEDVMSVMEKILWVNLSLYR